MNLRHLNLMKLSRDTLLKWCKDEDFNAVMAGLYCRVVMRNTTGQKYYRVGKILHMKEGSGPLAIVLSHGDQVKPFSLEFVSNGDFNEEELVTYVETEAKEGERLPTPGEINRKLKEMKEFLDGRTLKQQPDQRKRKQSPGEDEGEIEKLNVEVRGKVTALTQKNKAKENQTEQLGHEVSRLRQELQSTESECRNQLALLTNERDVQKQHRLKLKELDYLISFQRRTIDGLKEQLETERQLQDHIAKKRRLVSAKLKGEAQPETTAEEAE